MLTNETIIWLAVSLAATIAFVLLGRMMAKRKNRNSVGWALAVGIFPPVALVLLFLPPLKDRSD